MDLHIKSTQFVKLAYEQVSESASDWTKNVLEAFYNQFPTFVNTPLQVEWKKRDEDRGYALGVITFEGNTNLNIPIIIEKRLLYPFDTMFMGSRAMPLTDYTLQTLIQTRSAFSKTVPRERGDVSDALFNPSFSQVIYPNYKVASFIDRISGTITKEARDKVLNTLQTDPQIAEGFYRNKTYGVIEKIAALKGQEETDIRDSISRDLDRDIHYIYKTGRFNYRAIWGNSKVDDPVEMEIPAEVGEALPQIKTASCGCSKNSKPQIKKIGVFNVQNRDYQLAVDELGNYVQIPAHEKTASLTHTWSTNNQLEMYADGVFKFGESVTPPFQILSVVTEKNKTYIDTFNGLEKVAYVKLYGIDRPTQADGVTYIPIDTQFIKLAQQDVFVKDWFEGNYRNRVIKTAEDRFTLDGPVFAKYGEAHAITDINTHAATWALIACSANNYEVENMNKLAAGQELVLFSCLHAPASMQKIAGVISQQNIENAKAAQGLALDLLKEAAAIPDEPTVDAILSLGFLNKDNILEFIEAIPMYEEVASSLAKMLMSARLGFKAVNEAVVRKTMFGLVEILQVLHGVKSLAIKR